ncbi:hypothetical protein MB901379_00132 [Mycobacterium basiliense]|uniref:PE family protein n=1 Tax=Mycobacterium basiliense TaxID=2094119 RepID=A0A3S4BEK3_9MYCO|nr:hypothetical protein [Mycobacterium basiliense]VDM86613.1 hypothetical protein MB901379_00132 [Mycobacterium basiliense]
MTASNNPVTVDATALEAAGEKLRILDFPSPPKPPISLASDYAALANNEVLPHIYFAVRDVLANAKAALDQLGANMVAAANAYSHTDQTLGVQLSRFKFQVPESNSATSGESLQGPEGK